MFKKNTEITKLYVIAMGYRVNVLKCSISIVEYFLLPHWRHGAKQNETIRMLSWTFSSYCLIKQEPFIVTACREPLVELLWWLEFFYCMNDNLLDGSKLWHQVSSPAIIDKNKSLPFVSVFCEILQRRVRLQTFLVVR